MKRKLLFVLFSLGSYCLLAGTGNKMDYHLYGIGFIINNNPNQVIHQAIVGGSVNWATQVNSEQTFYSFTNTLELLQHESTNLPVNFEYELTIKGTLEYFQIGGSTITSQDVTLHIDNKLQGSSRQMDFYSYSNAYDSKFILTSLNLTGTAPQGSDLYTEVAKVVELNFGIQITHYTQPDLSIPISISSVPCLDNSSNELILSWSNIDYAEEYELEVLYVDDYSADGTALNPINIPYDFRDNATRIILKQSSYRLPLVYDRGYLLYRVRAVGRGGPQWDKRIPGPWSQSPPSGINFVSNFSDKKYIAVNEAHTINKLNWQLTTTYADDGKRKDVVQYSDGLYMTRQTVTGVSEAKNIFTENINDNGLNSPPLCAFPVTDKVKEIIAQENIYDFNGRVGLQIMPVPTGTHKIDYIPHLNQNTSGQVYSWVDFDKLTNCFLSVGELNQNTTGAFGAGQYYSQNNPNKIGYNAFIPDGTGYPFSRVQYTDDNTGKVYRQGGVGKNFQLETTHETKFFYATPNQVELDRMFGTEVGSAERYLKKMVVDPNGQTSVTYENPEGKTIATALTGIKPDNLLALDNEIQNAVTIDVNAMENNVIDNFTHSMSANKQFLVPATGEYIFNYNVKGEILNYITCNDQKICLDCIYDLGLTLRSNDGCTTIPFFNYSGTFGDLTKETKVPHIDKDCFDGTGGYIDKPEGFPTSFTRTLNQGSYTLEKTLTVNKNAAEAYVNLVFADTCRAKFDEIFHDEMSRIDTLDCYQTCASCQKTFPNKKSDECAELCPQPLNDCDQARKMMLADLKPGGQYAQFSVDSNGKYYSVDPLSIFCPTSSCKLPINPSLSTIVDLTITDITNPHNINNRISNWNLTPAQEIMLLQSHPEHCMLEWCDIQNTGKYFDLKLRTANTYADAVNLGIINNGSTPADAYLKMLTNDPFFSTSGPGTPHDEFLGLMNNVCATNETLLQLAMHAAYCSSSPDVQNLVSSIVNNQGGSLDLANASVPLCVLPSGYLSNLFGSNPDTKEMEWKMLRDFYLSYKEKYLYRSRLAYSKSGHCFNGCIGSDNYSFVNWPSDPFSYSAEGPIQVNPADPCGIFYGLYKYKVKRFTNRYDAFSHTTSQTPFNLTDIDLYDNCPSLANVTAIQSQAGAITSQFLCDSLSAGPTDELCQLLCNSSFEQILGEQTNANSILLGQDNVPCWKTTAIDHKIEICHLRDTVIASSGGHFVELNGSPQDKLYQVFSSTGTKNVKVSFAYRGRNGLKIKVSMGIDGGPYTDLGTYSATETPWATYSTPPYTLNTGSYRLIFESVLANSGNGPNHSGNFLDAITVNCTDVLPRTNSDAKSSTVAVRRSTSVPSGNQTPGILIDKISAGRQIARPVGTVAKSDLCKTLSPFANELFGFLIELKKPKLPNEGRYSYKKRKSILYSRFAGSTAIQYAYHEGRECSVQFTGRSTRELEDATCTVTFADCNWKNEATTLVSIQPYFENGNAQTNQFILTYLDNITHKFSQVKGTSNCLPINECKDPLLCGDTLLVLPPDTTNYNACVEAKYLMAHENAQHRYTHWLDSMRTDLLEKYYAKCMKAIETLRYTYTDTQFHYTLYYYDQAGNLTRTIPPAGIRLLGTADVADIDAKRIANSGMKVPDHVFVTNYKYNSLNQLVEQTTPDAGKSNFFYDKLGRIAASQNAKQQPVNNYSYTYYDLLGRTVESGELVNVPLAQTTIDSYAGWEAFLHNASNPRRDITYTRYDEFFNTAINNKFGSAGQQNLRGRVAGIFSFADNTQQATGTYLHATLYTYDVGGNIPVVIQDNHSTTFGDKVIAYNYDLVSGKVNEVRYQPGMQDEFRHKYSYDDNLRLTDVYTSRKGIIWQHDAEYFYYKHGPLARTELGQLKVQGLDYIYTLQGWIKGVNGTDEEIKLDAGRDGIALNSPKGTTDLINGQQVNTTVENNGTYNTTGEGYHSIHNPIAADAFGYVLSYFDGDYSPITPTTSNLNTTLALNTFMAGVQPLFNGNISRMYTYLQKLGGLGMNYGYDQLNRLKYQQAFTLTGNTPSPLDAYSMDLNYDGNGNIINLLRTGRPGNQNMDKLAYTYYDANNVEIPYVTFQTNPPANVTNRLASVKDMINSSNYPETASPLNGTVTDIDNQSPNNYTYDAIGNLIGDNSENISTIRWNLQNKITEIDKPDSKLFFTYDPLGNRVSKKYVTNGSSTETIYVRDASGTIMGTYVNKDNVLTWKEQELYGSSRLGIWQPNQPITANPTAWTGTVDWQHIQPLTFIEDSLVRGSKQYELTNHLGNVLATISDRRIQTIPAPNGTSGIAVDLSTATDYYAFGMQMPGRNFSGGNYRFGFNGKENDNEVKGDGNQQDYGFRIYDPRLGKMLSPDPKETEYPWQSTYSYYANSPIAKLDYNGEGDYYDKNGKHFGSDGKTVKNNKGVDVPDNKAYTITQQIFDNATCDGKTDWDEVGALKGTTDITTKFGYTNSQILEGASMAYNEGESTFEGRSAIVNVLVYRKNQGKTFDQVMGGLAGYGVGKTHDARMESKWFGRYKDFWNAGDDGRNKNSIYKNCISASIGAMTGGKDYSNGANYWHGPDFFSNSCQKNGNDWAAYRDEYLTQGFKWSDDAVKKKTPYSYFYEIEGSVSKDHSYIGKAYYGGNTFMKK